MRRATYNIMTDREYSGYRTHELIGKRAFCPNTFISERPMLKSNNAFMEASSIEFAREGWTVVVAHRHQDSHEEGASARTDSPTLRNAAS